MRHGHAFQGVRGEEKSKSLVMVTDDGFKARGSLGLSGLQRNPSRWLGRASWRRSFEVQLKSWLDGDGREEWVPVRTLPITAWDNCSGSL